MAAQNFASCAIQSRIPVYPDCELGVEAARPCEALLIDIARWRARSFVAARRNSCNRPSKTQVSEKAQFAAGERDAATRIFISTKTPTGSAIHQCPANPASLKMRILSQLFTLRNFLLPATATLATFCALPQPRTAFGRTVPLKVQSGACAASRSRNDMNKTLWTGIL